MTVTRSFSPLRQRGSTLTGIIIGLIIGLGIAVAVALVITKGASPFTERSNKSGRPADLEPSLAADPNKPLYGNRDAVRDANRAIAERPTPAAPAGGASAVTDGYIYFLQAGAFRAMSDAENTRAKLALLGFEAAITDRTTDAGVLHRVRVGPYSQVEAVNKARAKLLDSGIDVAIVRNQR